MGYSDENHPQPVTPAMTISLVKDIWDSNDRRLTDVSDAIDNKDGMKRQASDARFLRKTADTMTGNVDIGNDEITNVRMILNSSAISGLFMMRWVHEQLSSTILWELFENFGHSSCYRLDYRTYYLMDSSTSPRQCETLYNQSRSDIDANSTGSERPFICLKSERVNNHYWLDFRKGQRIATTIDINPLPGGTLEYHRDAINFFIVYQLRSLDGSNAYWYYALFGNDPLGGGYHPFVALSPQRHLLISGTYNNYAVIQPPSPSNQWRNTNKIPVGTYSVNSNPCAFN